ncbi:cupin domain-containing protein [Actinomadura graeca]|uniref:Cupin domain-containing protein n=1 Tax=Actinomadura graeca TaxID=2750812 RepID=A0ABX8QYC0_9ACTN|nr:cupin domain-containing protein [Actinomadura graeca]QXJ23845.1 cupin domain-containing protein [Actinomadura graeca]
MSIRRVVTGHDGTGAAVVLRDGPATNSRRREAAGGLVSTLLWTTAETPARLGGADDRGDVEIGVAPPPRGSVFRVVEFPPLGAQATALNQADILAEMGIADDGGVGRRHPFTHRTASLDYGVVLSGRIRLILDADELVLAAGDVLVQQANDHAWVNDFDESCSVAFVLLDAATGR